MLISINCHLKKEVKMKKLILVTLATIGILAASIFLVEGYSFSYPFNFNFNYSFPSYPSFPSTTRYCTSNSNCASTQFCKFKTGTCSGFGTCTAKPEACIMLYAPVCGCDGKTYSSECVANSNRVNVKRTGAC